MAEVRLRKDFHGTLIPKVSSDSIRVSIDFDYKGPAQTLDIETNTGKRGLWGDYDQESPTYHNSKAVYASDTFRRYTFSRTIPLSFWGSREIDDCAVEVVIRGEGVYGDAVLWDAYTVNIGVPVVYTLEVTVEPPATGYVTKSPSKAIYSAGEVVTLTAYPYSGYEFDHWGGWPPYPGVGSTSPSISITMDANWWVVAAFRKAAPVTTVIVALRNPPSDAENWSLTLTDWDITVPIDFIGRNGKKRLDIAEAATFEIPGGLKFPLRVAFLQITKWNEARTALIQLYYVQSFRPYKWDFTKGAYGDEPDPNYREVFIPEYGSFYYNVATEQFEKV